MLLFAGLGVSVRSAAQCNPVFPQPLSQRPANYDISLTFDDQRHSIDAVQTIRFVNQSPVAIHELRLYLYLNAFKNTESTFLKGATNIFGQSFTNRKADEWGWIDVAKFERESGTTSIDLSDRKHFIRLDDGNPGDESVLEVPLDKPLEPGETGVFHLKWQAKLPKTIARAGYSQDFNFFCHWFPQLGVFQLDISGVWGWNCHQFFRHSEFFADFGVYDVRITAPEKYVMGASGCLVEEKKNGNGTVTRHFHAEDVIDFAWAAYPGFQVLEDQWQGVLIRLLLPADHLAMGPRYLHALKFALEYLDQHVGKYPYPSITVVDPPFHGLRSGLMEYPTLITTGTFYWMPKGIRTSESLIVHEFVHQYFMAMVASNEKEEPWLDEGFATYFEDRIIDAAYGEKHSVIDFCDYRFDNRELTRQEYTGMHNPREGMTAQESRKFSDRNYKALIYSKTATALRTVQALVGDEKMDEIIEAYFQKWKFRHPRAGDFMAVLHDGLMTMPDTVWGRQVYQLFYTSIYQENELDYAVTRISNEALFARQGAFGDPATGFTYEDGSGVRTPVSQVEVQRIGDWVFPVDLLITFEDGSTKTIRWSGVEGMKVFEFSNSPKIISAQIDPEYKIGLDLDINNNSLTLQPETAPLWKYTAKVLFWVQNLLQAVSFLV